MMVMRKILNSLFVVMLLILPARIIAAQEVQKIVAIVNNDIVSGYDVIQRLSLTIFMAGLPDTIKTRKQLVPTVIKALIDERLKLQEAARRNTEASDIEINSAIEQFEKRFNIRPGQLEGALASRRIDTDALLSQIRASIGWDKLIRRRIIPQVNITDAEIKSLQTKMRANKGKTEYLTQEIFLPVTSPRNEPEVRKLAQNLVSQIKKGASFSRIATQFSRGATAAKGGTVGWQMAEDMQPEIAQVVTQTKKGTATSAIRTADGYYIIAVQDVRKILSDTPSDSVVELNQLVIPLAPAIKTNNKDSQIALAKALSKFINSCETLPGIFNQLSNAQTGKMGQMKLSNIPEKFRALVANLKDGEASAPYLDKDVYRIFVVCGRQEAQKQSDSENAIRQIIGRKRIEARATRYLNDLRRIANIESR